MEADKGKIVWGDGTVTPTEVFEYVLYNPETSELDYLYTGIFGGYGSKVRRFAMRDAHGNWVDEILEKANNGFLPMYNVMGISSPQRKVAKVVILETEAEVDAFEGFFRESQDQYVGISFLSGVSRQPDCKWFRNREVIIWPHKKDEGDAWASRLEGYIRRYASSVKLVNSQALKSSGFIETLNHPQEGASAAMLAIEMAGGAVLDRPVVRLWNGFSSLSGFIPPIFKDRIVDQYADPKTGRIDADYETALAVCKEDPAFDNFVKMDRATGMMVFSPFYHNSYEEADNALLNRLTQYHFKRLEKNTRSDLIRTLSLRDGAVVNSVTDVFNRLSVKYPEPKNRLNDILRLITFEEEESRGLYEEMFDVYFSRCAAHIFRAYTESPIPNDLVPVFVGGQGVGKSRFVRYLALEENLFQDLGDKGVSLGSADCIRHISGKIIVELSEMSVYTRTEIGTAKAFISQTVDEFRQIYERSMTKIPRCANFVGTTNEAQFLKDMTGNRRFFPVRVKKIAHEFLYQHPELIEETWAFYWRQAKYNPEAWFELSQPIIDFFFQENEIAMDIGFTSDLVEVAVLRAEAEIYRRRRADRYSVMYITPFAVGTEIQKMGTGAIPGNLNRVVNYHLRKLGYESSIVRDNGRAVRSMRISLDDEGLLKRVKPRAEPNF